MNSPRILVIGGMHGNERLGVDLVKLLKTEKITNVSAIIANPAAVKANARYIESDLNRSFGIQYNDTSERKIATELTSYVQTYDIVLDFHNTMTSANNCTFVGEDCDKQLYSVSKQLGLFNCIEATYDCINKYCPNVISIEISEGDAKNNPVYWYAKIQELSSGLQESKRSLMIYRYQQRVDWSIANSNDFQWRPFKLLSAKDKKILNLDGIIVPIFIGSKLTEYYATLLSKERTE